MACAAALLFPALASLSWGMPRENWAINVLSGRADMVTGNGALVSVSIPPGISRSAFRVLLNGRDVTPLFRPDRDTDLPVGLLQDLELGRNLVEITCGGKQRARLELINHPITGPVFSGPHQAPFICQTEAVGLGTPVDGNCSAPTRVTYYYKSTNPPERGAAAGAAPGWGIPPGFKVLDTAGPRPSDVAKVTTSEGNTVNYVVRREMGTINRAIYAIAFLHEPNEPLPDPWRRVPGWNGRLVYLFGGGCSAGYHQGAPLPALNDMMLSQGYAVATASLNVFGNDCNDLISTETMMMVKEHFIEQFGAPIYTIGSGGSGGAMQQYLIAQNYPGLLDGIMPSVSYPDIISTLTFAVDCALLDQAFRTSSLTWTEEQKTSVSGFATWKTAERWNGSFSPGWVLPTRCAPVIPKSLVYDTIANPTGTRCGIYDNQVNAFGRDPGTGFARRALDNVGVQYGLVAFNQGKITAEQFLDLNERIGGYDLDGKIVPQRTSADPEALRLAYQTGRINTATDGLSAIPIIDVRPYTDDTGDIHDRVRSLATRARLIAANGSADNQVIWTVPGTSGDGERRQGPGNAFDASLKEALRQMDLWLSAIKKDRSSKRGTAKVARNRPSGLSDACWTASGEKILETASSQATRRCDVLFPIHGDPRIAAGAPLAGDILKCALQPVDPKDYASPMTADQVKRLRRIFSSGVCDYSRPGIAQQKAPATWRRY